MHEHSYNDEILFDRLVDGELSDDERRRLLESLDTRPDGWRQCALAFLEAQSWGRDFGDLVRRPAAAKIAVERASTKQQAFGHGAAWLGIAAGLLVAATLAVMHNRSNSGPPIAGVAQPGGQIADVAPPPTPHAAKTSDALTLYVNGPDGKRQPVVVPLVDAKTLDRQLGMQFQSGVPADVRSQLQDRGYDVQSKRRYAPLWLENGRPMVVPVEDTMIMPVNQKVY